MELPDPENLKGLTRPIVRGAAIAGIIYTILSYYEVDLPISEEQAAALGGLIATAVTWIYTYLHSRFVKPAQVKAKYARLHIMVDDYLAKGWITPRQARLLHAKLVKDEILGIPLGTDFKIDFWSEVEMSDDYLELPDDDDDDDPPAGGTDEENDDDDNIPPTSGPELPPIPETSDEKKVKVKVVEEAASSETRMWEVSTVYEL